MVVVGLGVVDRCGEVGECRLTVALVLSVLSLPFSFSVASLVVVLIWGEEAINTSLSLTR